MHERTDTSGYKYCKFMHTHTVCIDSDMDVISVSTCMNILHI